MAEKYELTKQEQKTFDIIQKAGSKGIGFEQLMTKLGLNAEATLRGRISSLKRKGAIRSEKGVNPKEDGKLAVYFAR